MRIDGPSLTARGVALARSTLARPSTRTGDPAADERLAGSLADGFAAQIRDEPPSRFRQGFVAYLAERTRFFDEAVLRALDDDVHQVVILGAGYDGRALRFRTPGVRFFEVDHPATQRDKRRRLLEIDASTEGIAFVAADFTEPGLAAKLTEAGHDRAQRSLFMCEGVLRYLPERWFRELLRVACEQAALGSELAVSISTRSPVTDEAERRDRAEREQRLAASGEPVLTVPDRDLALAWLADAGWTLERVDDGPDRQAGTWRSRLLVRARR